jgi:hypothetical protein
MNIYVYMSRICLVIRHITETNCVLCIIRAETEKTGDSLNITTEIDWVLCKIRTETDKKK